MMAVLSNDLGGALPSTMPDRPLGIRAIFEHAITVHARKHIISRDGQELRRFTYAQFGRRVAQLANALRTLGVRPGDRVASFAWNGHRHLELYYAVPMIGAVLHTVNIRLFPDQAAFVLDHAGDKIVFYDGSLVKAVKAAAALDPAAGRTFVQMGTGAGSVRRRARLRDAHGGRDGRVRLAGRRRASRGDPVLHVGDDGRSERRPVLPPLDVHPRAGERARRRARASRSATACCPSCRCSTSTRGARRSCA